MKNIYLILITLFFTLTIVAQELVVKGLVTVEESALLHVDGDVEIQSTGELANNGTVETTGNWANQRTQGDVTDNGSNGERLVRFIGTGHQTISGGSSGWAKFHNVVVTNKSYPAGFVITTAGLPAYTPGSGLETQDSIDVETLDISAGDLIMMQYTLAVNADGLIGYANMDFSNGNNITHFDETGTIRRKFSSSVNTYEFPIHREGIGNVHATLYFGPSPVIPFGFGNGGYIDAKFTASIDPPSLSPGELGHVNRQWQCGGSLLGAPGIQHISIDQLLEEDFGFWEISPFNSSNEYVGYGDWEYDLRVRIPAGIVEKFHNDYGSEYLKLIKIPSHETNGTYIPFMPWSNHFNNPPYGWTHGIVSSSGLNLCDGMRAIVDYPGHNFPGQYDESEGLKAHKLSTFSRTGIGGNGNGAGLPIELLYLEANAVDNVYIRLDWATAVEINNSGFEVLRSEDGINFQQRDWVEGNGNTTEQKYYGYNDYDVVPNKVYYYMLNQIDFDGTSEHTYIVSAMINSTNVFVISEFMPNPTTDNSVIEITSSIEKNVNVTMYNTLGQVIRRADESIVPGKNRIKFSVNELAAGTYYAIIRVDNEVHNRKLILTRE